MECKKNRKNRAKQIEGIWNLIYFIRTLRASTVGTHQIVLCGVGNAASEIDCFRYCTILYGTGTRTVPFIYLDNFKWSFSRAVKFPGNVFTGDEYLITYLVVIIYPQIIIPMIIFIYDDLFSEPNSFPVSYKFNI